jgi:hypothetical protein
MKRNLVELIFCMSRDWFNIFALALGILLPLVLVVVVFALD